MKKTFTILSILVVLTTLIGCSNKPTVYVWNMMDVIKLWVVGIIVAVAILLLTCAWVIDKINAWKRRKRK
jgi:hypothetical protein